MIVVQHRSDLLMQLPGNVGRIPVLEALSGWRWGSGLAGWGDEEGTRPIPRFPLPGTDHQRGSVAIPLLQHEPAGRGVAAGRPRRGGLVREHPAVVSALWPGIRQETTPTSAAAGEQVA